MHEPLPEGALVALLYKSVGANDAAREELLSRLWVAIYPYVYGLVRHRDDAEDLADDLTQETLLRILPKLWLCRATVDAEVVSWALTVAHHVMIDDYRKHIQRDVRRLSPELESIVYHEYNHPLSCCHSTRPELPPPKIERNR